MKRTSTARQIFSTSSIMLTVPMILAPLDIKKPESKPLQSMRISFPLRKWKMPKIRSSENITFRTQKSTVHSIGRPRLTENYPIHTEPGKGYLVVILSLNVRALNKNLFPLNCGRRLRGDIIAYAVYAAHLVDDVVRYFGEEFVGEVRPVCCHGIHRSYGA